MDIPPPPGADVRTQPDGTIGCVTCHLGHDSQSATGVWSPQTDASICAECHWTSGNSHQLTAELAHMLTDTESRRIEGRALTQVCSGCHASNDSHGDTTVAASSSGGAGAGLGISHPVLVDYAGAAKSNARAMRPLSQLPSDVLLEGGQVGCVSCHDLFSEFEMELIRSNADSDLCLACHSMGALPVYAGNAIPTVSGMRARDYAQAENDEGGIVAR